MPGCPSAVMPIGSVAPGPWRAWSLEISVAPEQSATATPAPDSQRGGAGRHPGYKQVVPPHETKGIWTPFVIMGHGVKKRYALRRPIRAVDPYPTIMDLMGPPIPPFAEGRKLYERFD